MHHEMQPKRKPICNQINDLADLVA